MDKRPPYRRRTPSMKELKTRKDQLYTKLRLVRSERDDAAREARKIEEKIARIQQEIDSMTTEPTVSEHAVIRFLEHVIGMDMAQLRAEIMPPELAKTIENLGDGKYPISEGRGMAIVKNNVIVSVVPTGESALEIAKNTEE